MGIFKKVLGFDSGSTTNVTTEPAAVNTSDTTGDTGETSTKADAKGGKGVATTMLTTPLAANQSSDDTNQNQKKKTLG